jgi:molecular chaperone GrpE
MTEKEKEKTTEEHLEVAPGATEENTDETGRKQDVAGSGVIQEKTRHRKKEAPEEEVQDMQAKIDELNDKYLRLYAEFDNYRKRILKEKLEYNKMATADLIASLLTILDDFDRAMKLSETTENIDAVREGERLIFNKLKTILEQNGLQEMSSLGEPFNTDLHEAITSVPAPSEEMKGKIIDETMKGYMLNGKVLRYAKVVVGT